MKLFTFLSVIILLGSCGTPEFRREESICTSTWLSRIQPLFEQEMYNQSKSRQVSTGRTTCTGVGNSVRCTEEMKTEYYTIPAVRTVDRNETRRNAQIKLCTQNICSEKFGNIDCES